MDFLKKHFKHAAISGVTVGGFFGAANLIAGNDVSHAFQVAAVTTPGVTAVYLGLQALKPSVK